MREGKGGLLGPTGPGRLSCQLLPFSSQALGNPEPLCRTSLVNHRPWRPALEQVGQKLAGPLPPVSLGTPQPLCTQER